MLVGGAFLSPQPVEYLIGGDHGVGVDQQECEERLLAERAEFDEGAVSLDFQ